MMPYTHTLPCIRNVYAALLLIGSLCTTAQAANTTMEPAIQEVPASQIVDMAASMVEVRAARIEADRFLPWRNTVPRWQTGYAVAVQPGVFLTPEILVRNQAAIQIRRAGSVQPIPAEVILSDPRVGLALIRALDQNWFPEAVALHTLDVIPRSGDFTIVQWGANDHLQAGIGNLLSIGYDSIGEGIPAQLTYALASPLQVSHSGTPVLYGDKLAGMAMRFESGRRGILILSPDSITRFLDASRHDDYAGVPEPDFESIPLADPVRRRFLGVPEIYQNRGIHVLRVHKDPARDHGLQANDVLLTWDGMELDARGNYDHPAYGRIPFQHLVAQRAPGDAAKATIVRKQELQEVAVTVRPYAEVFRSIPENTTGEPDDYVVAAGFIFRELTIDYLRAAGDNWQRRADIDLTWRAYAAPARTDEPPRSTVILVGVLADPINIGYRELRNHIVQGINGQPIENLAELATRIDQDGFTSVTLQGMEAVPLAFDPIEAEAANLRIQQRFQIPALRRISKP